MLSRTLEKGPYTKDTLLGQKGECAISKNEIIHISEQVGAIVDTKYEQIHKRCVTVAHLERQLDRLAAYRENLPGIIKYDAEGNVKERILNTTEELRPQQCNWGTDKIKEQEEQEESPNPAEQSKDNRNEQTNNQRRLQGTETLDQEINTDRAYQRAQGCRARVKEEVDSAYQGWLEWRNQMCDENSPDRNRIRERKNKRRKTRKTIGRRKPKKNMTNQEIRAAHGNIPAFQSTIKAALWNVLRLNQSEQQIKNSTQTQTRIVLKL